MNELYMHVQTNVRLPLQISQRQCIKLSCRPLGVKEVRSVTSIKERNTYVFILILSCKAKEQHHSFSLWALGETVQGLALCGLLV